MAEKDKLDRARSFGTVYGDPNCGFFQDGKPFRHDGTLYVPPPAPSRTDEIAPVSEERRAAQSLSMKRVWAEKREALAKSLSGDTEP